jgi:hypothetical protein
MYLRKEENLDENYSQVILRYFYKSKCSLGMTDVEPIK